MKLALECRTNMLEMVQPFADFDFVLAHKVLEDEEYLNYYKGSGNFKFVDNSVNEQGTPLSPQELLEACEKVGGTYLVAPDYIGDAPKTIEAYRECKKLLIQEESKAHMQAKGRVPGPQIVGVIQGQTFTDAYECLEVYSSGIICVPYDLCSEKTDPPWLMGLRRALFISNIPRDRGLLVHLLGFTGLDELFWYQNNPIVISIDTGIPVLLGLEGRNIEDPLESKEEPTFNRMEKIELTQKGWTGVLRNIAILRKYIT